MSDNQNAAPEAVAWRFLTLYGYVVTKTKTTSDSQPLYADPAGTIARLQERVKVLENMQEYLAGGCGVFFRYDPLTEFTMYVIPNCRPDEAPMVALAQAKDRNRALTEALEKYGRHLEDCRVKGWFPPQNAVHRICTCGLGAILHPTQPKEQNDGPT